MGVEPVATLKADLRPLWVYMPSEKVCGCLGYHVFPTDLCSISLKGIEGNERLGARRRRVQTTGERSYSSMVKRMSTFLETDSLNLPSSFNECQRTYSFNECRNKTPCLL